MCDSTEQRSVMQGRLDDSPRYSFPKGLKLNAKNVPPSENMDAGEYTPHRSTDSETGFGPPKVKPNLRRPFVVPLGDTLKRVEGWQKQDGSPVYRRDWYHAVGCAVFDGLCVNQADFDEIDCTQCIKSTFESFIKGCLHREVYVDHRGTLRCLACKDELGQVEDPDVFEDDDAAELDDPPEYSDPEDIFQGGRERYRAWGIDSQFRQTPVESKTLAEIAKRRAQPRPRP